MLWLKHALIHQNIYATFRARLAARAQPVYTALGSSARTAGDMSETAWPSSAARALAALGNALGSALGSAACCLRRATASAYAPERRLTHASYAASSATARRRTFDTATEETLGDGKRELLVRGSAFDSHAFALATCFYHIMLNATLAILGGDDAGLGAAWAAGSLGIGTLLVLAHPRDLGGERADAGRQLCIV